jgi:hypothetical protein
MKDIWKNNSLYAKVSVGVMALAMLYLFFFDGESFIAWSIFFISLATTVFLNKERL